MEMPKDLPVTEDTPFQEAECPYARTKQMGEKIIEDFCKVSPDFSAILLRYFNPAGGPRISFVGRSTEQQGNQSRPGDH
ncbi:MAG: NAD-dependent epimerase/dehydratase family protein [Saprospiraceae bacterium]